VRITLVNQAFHPDVVSSGQHLTDLAVALAEHGHDVTVITSRHAYDDPTKEFPARETWRGIRIFRVFNTGYGKAAKWRRAVDFLTFLVSCCVRLCLLSRPDVIVSLTSPPLVSVIAAGYAWLRRAKFCYWIMDLNPDEAIAAGWLESDSFPAKWLERLSRFSMKRAAMVVVLDVFMQRRILAKGIPIEKVTIIPPWSHDSEVRFDSVGREIFRERHGLENKFVVMYSGNHSPVHPLDTLLAAVKDLAVSNKDVLFCFVGGGSEHGRVKCFAEVNRLSNILCLAYQPLEDLSASLSAADVHVVVMGDAMLGLVHPCKIYNILAVGAPVLYLGPEPSHVTEVLTGLKSDCLWASVQHGAVEDMVCKIRQMHENSIHLDRRPSADVKTGFSKSTLLPRLVALIESMVVKPDAATQPAALLKPPSPI
jgi:colanic acid biosynthesis glycosyl transferase WcaI